MGGGRGEGGAKSYDGNKAWPSINHSILSGFIDPRMQANHWGAERFVITSYPNGGSMQYSNALGILVLVQYICTELTDPCTVDPI